MNILATDRAFYDFGYSGYLNPNKQTKWLKTTFLHVSHVKKKIESIQQNITRYPNKRNKQKNTTENTANIFFSMIWNI